MAGATFLHWDKFNQAHVSFYAWLILYVVTPVLVPVVWLRNRRTDPRTPAPGELLVPAPIRTVARVLGVVLVATALLMFVLPDVAMSQWPWTLTPLTTRVIAGWFALAGALAFMYSTDVRWASWRILLQSQGLGVALILLGALRAWGDFDPGRPMTWIFLVGLSVLLALLVALYVAMERQRTRAAGSPQVSEAGQPG